MNDQYKEEMAILQKKIFELENTPNENDNKKTNFDINVLKKISEIQIFYEDKKTAGPMRKKSRNENKDDEEENEEDEDFNDDDENEEEFLEKIKKLNHKKKGDNKEMIAYRKENRKLLARYEYSLDEIDELKEKMKKIEELISQSQNNLKIQFQNILSFVTISNKGKGNVIQFMKSMQFSDEEINYLIS